MPEPTTTTAAATYAATGPAIALITAFGVPLGLRADVLIAGFLGALAGIILLNSVPSNGDTWPELVRTTTKRMFVTLASAVTAGYLTPLTLLLANVPEPLFLGGAFAVGAGARNVLVRAMSRAAGQGGTGSGGGAAQ